MKKGLIIASTVAMLSGIGIGFSSFRRNWGGAKSYTGGTKKIEGCQRCEPQKSAWGSG